MLRLTILSSGSAGNCSLIEADGCRILVDCGLSARQVVLRLDRAGVRPESLDAILVTHEHVDHVQGLQVFCKRWELPIYCNGATARELRDGAGSSAKDWRLFETGGAFEVAGVAVESFPVPHDAADPVGFLFRKGRSSVGFLTDLGHATKLVVERVRDAEVLVLEANHDEKMLQDDPRRPWTTKQRIQSRHGHLSNAAAGAVVEQLLGGALRRVVLGHLSRDCNRPELALATVRAVVERAGAAQVEVECAPHCEMAGAWVAGGGEGV